MPGKRRTIIYEPEYERSIAVYAGVMRHDEIMRGLEFVLARIPDTHGRQINKYVWVTALPDVYKDSLDLFYTFDTDHVYFLDIVPRRQATDDCS